MLTQKLYYQDPYLTNFTTKMTHQAYDDNVCPYVTLEQTAFYPTGGGQPCDLGTLNGREVIGVEEVEGQIKHFLREPMPASTLTLEGKIDWDRRFDHMQQHAGQHILSAVFEELFAFKTIAFHLGRESNTIDLDVEALTDPLIKQAEERANNIVFQNRPIETKWVEPDELDHYPLRKQPSVSENIRLVIMEGFDYNPCGGTHPKQTAEVGPIKIIGWERHRQHVRLQFICGKRSLNDFNAKQTILKSMSRLLQSAEKDLPEKVEKLLQSQEKLEKYLSIEREKLINLEANDLIRQSSEDEFGLLVVAKSFSDRPLKECQHLAQIITEQEDNAVVLLTLSSGDRVQLVCARGKQPDINMNDLVKSVLPLINGKGGGKPAFAQGGGQALLTEKECLDHLIASLVK